MGVTLFHLLPQPKRGFRFGVCNSTPDTQACPRFDGGTTPVFTRFLRFYGFVSTFLRPTYVHRPSI
jgi:hypothetical protein